MSPLTPYYYETEMKIHHDPLIGFTTHRECKKINIPNFLMKQAQLRTYT